MNLGWPRLVEQQMEKVCNVSLVPDIAAIPNIESWLRQAAVERKAGWRCIVLMLIPCFATIVSNKCPRSNQKTLQFLWSWTSRRLGLLAHPWLTSTAPFYKRS